jgi:hypothetical protein
MKLGEIPISRFGKRINQTMNVSQSLVVFYIPQAVG